MSKFNLQGLVNNISEKTTAYAPIVEAIVNSIESIEEGKVQNGIINVVVKRERQMPLEINEDTLPRIKSIKIEDNGEGFTNENRDSFDTLYSDQKIQYGGKGFGRFIFLKYFKDVRVDSLYKELDEKYRRTFAFSGDATHIENLIQDEKIIKVVSGELKTVIELNDLKDRFMGKLDKKLETIARNLVEKLLPYFINETYNCPTISLQEEGKDEKIILNNYFNEHEGIIKIADTKIKLKKTDYSEDFEVKIFKIYFTPSPSSVILTANNRAVTTKFLHEYVPEFKEDFYEKTSSDKDAGNKNYSIKAYVVGKYLDKYVSLERNDFMFMENGEGLFYPFSKEEIEIKATDVVVENFKDEVISRQKKKEESIKKYVDNVAPWHKLYYSDLDLNNIPYHFDEDTLEGELQKVKFKKDQAIRSKVSDILDSKDGDVLKQIDEISNALTELGKSDLAHYVVLRRVVLNLLRRSLEWKADKKYEKEKVVHNIIFPMNSDSKTLSYDQHNLWIIDERLSFQEYIASDKILNKDGDRPDLLVFDKPIVVREGDELSNPINIFEFKRPQREEYEDEENPIDQILNYVEKIRNGDIKDAIGRNIKANENTPAYGFLICDLTEKIKGFCKKSIFSNSQP